MQPLPHASVVPVPQPAPAGHSRPEAQFLRQVLPRDRGVEHEQDPAQHLAVTQRSCRPQRQQRRDLGPQVVRDDPRRLLYPVELATQMSVIAPTKSTWPSTFGVTAGHGGHRSADPRRYRQCSQGHQPRELLQLAAVEAHSSAARRTVVLICHEALVAEGDRRCQAKRPPPGRSGQRARAAAGGEGWRLLCDNLRHAYICAYRWHAQGCPTGPRGQGPAVGGLATSLVRRRCASAHRSCRTNRRTGSVPQFPHGGRARDPRCNSGGYWPNGPVVE